MGFKMKSGMKPSFKMMGSTPVKQYADKNVSVDKVSDDGRTFTGTDSKGNTGQYLTNAYDGEVMHSDSVGVTGNAVSNMQMEYDMVKGTKYEKDFIDYHGKGDKPGTGKTTTPAKQADNFDFLNLDTETDTDTDTDTDSDSTSVEGNKSKDYTIVSDDKKTTTRNVTRGGGTKTIKLEDTDGDPTVKTNKRGKKTTTPAEVKMTKTKRSGKVVEKNISKKRAERMRRRGRNKGQEYDTEGSAIKQRGVKQALPQDIQYVTPMPKETPGRKIWPAEQVVQRPITDFPQIHESIRLPIDVSHLPHNKENKTAPTKQTSHGPIKEFHPPMNPNEGPYIVRARKEMAKRQADMNYDGPDYRHIRERRNNPNIPWNPGQGGHDGPHPERPLKQSYSVEAGKLSKGKILPEENFSNMIVKVPEATVYAPTAEKTKPDTSGIPILGGMVNLPEAKVHSKQHPRKAPLKQRSAKKRAKQTTKSDIEQAARLGVNLDYDRLYTGNLEIERQKNQMVKDLKKKKKQQNKK